MPHSSVRRQRSRRWSAWRNLFTTGAEVRRSLFLTITASVFLLLLLIWISITSTNLVSPLFLPSPQSVWTRVVTLGENGTLWTDMGASLYRILVGFLISSLMAVPIGVLMGSYGFWESALEPLVDFIRYMPVVAFLPLTILWIGTGDFQKFLIIWMGTFFQQVLMVMDNVKRVPRDFVGLGRTLGLSEFALQTKIVVPFALPAIWDTLRITMGWAWTWLLVAELIAANTGLGYRIMVSQRYFQTNTIIGYIVVIGLLGLISDQTMKALARILFRNRQAEA